MHIANAAAAPTLDAHPRHAPLSPSDGERARERGFFGIRSFGFLSSFDIRILSFLSHSPTVQVSIMKSPINGMYVYRSAIDCTPTCTSPIAGTSIPKNHNQPITSHDCLRPRKTTAVEMPANSIAAATTLLAGQCPGCGYNTARSTGKNILQI